MIFTPVDLDSWERKSHYEYYTKLLKCGYSVTVSLDITKLHRQVKEKGLRFYPVFVYCVSRQIAATKEFRMAPWGTPSVVALTRPPSITPDFRNERMRWTLWMTRT